MGFTLARFKIFFLRNLKSKQNQEFLKTTSQFQSYFIMSKSQFRARSEKLKYKISITSEIEE